MASTHEHELERENAKKGKLETQRERYEDHDSTIGGDLKESNEEATHTKEEKLP